MVSTLVERLEQVIKNESTPGIETPRRYGPLLKEVIHEIVLLENGLADAKPIREALESLVDAQTGPPLIRGKREWTEAMLRACIVLGREDEVSRYAERLRELNRCQESNGSDGDQEVNEQIAELKTIVDKLPKCCRLIDGKPVWDVPVVPGMEIYVPGTGSWVGKVWKIKVTAIDSRGYVSTNIGGRPQHWHIKLCAATRESAEQARKETER